MNKYKPAMAKQMKTPKWGAKMTPYAKRKMLAASALLGGRKLITELPKLYQKHKRFIKDKGLEETAQLLSRYKLLPKEKQSTARQDVALVHGLAQLIKRHKNKNMVMVIGNGMLRAKNGRRKHFVKKAIPVATASALAGLLYAGSNRKQNAKLDRYGLMWSNMADYM